MQALEGRFSNGMNPKTINDLDPKLRATYEQVMGTSTNPAPAAPPKIEVQQEAQQPAAETLPPPPPASGTGSQVFRASDSPKETTDPTQNDTKEKKKSKFPFALLIGMGVVIFFAAYAVIWAKLLGLF
jgi:hypothetical protein